jgi:hypothetical protein
MVSFGKLIPVMPRQDAELISFSGFTARYVSNRQTDQRKRVPALQWFVNRSPHDFAP